MKSFAFSIISVFLIFLSDIPAQGPEFKVNEVRIILKDKDTKSPLANIPVALEYWSAILNKVWYSDQNGWVRPDIIYPDAIPNTMTGFKAWALAKGKLFERKFTLPPWNERSTKLQCKNCRNILFFEWHINLKESAGKGGGQNPPAPPDCNKWTTEIVAGPDTIPCECSSTNLFCVTITNGKAPDQKKRVKRKLRVTLLNQAGASMEASLGGLGFEFESRSGSKSVYSKEVDEEVNLGTQDYGEDICGRECLAVMETQVCVRAVYYGCILVRGHHGKAYWKKMLVQASDPYPIRVASGLCVGIYKYDCKKGAPKFGSKEDPCRNFRITPDTCKRK